MMLASHKACKCNIKKIITTVLYYYIHAQYNIHNCVDQIQILSPSVAKHDLTSEKYYCHKRMKFVSPSGYGLFH